MYEIQDVDGKKLSAFWFEDLAILAALGMSMIYGVLSVWDAYGGLVATVKDGVKVFTGA